MKRGEERNFGGWVGRVRGWRQLRFGSRGCNANKTCRGERGGVGIRFSHIWERARGGEVAGEPWDVGWKFGLGSR